MVDKGIEFRMEFLHIRPDLLLQRNAFEAALLQARIDAEFTKRHAEVWMLFSETHALLARGLVMTDVKARVKPETLSKQNRKRIFHAHRSAQRAHSPESFLALLHFHVPIVHHCNDQIHDENWRDDHAGKVQQLND